MTVDSASPIGVYEPILMVGLLIVMLTVLFGVVGRFRKEGMSVCRKDFVSDTEFLTEDDKDDKDDDGDDEGEDDKKTS
eukprot:CAMPEP_0196581902 /NCGR_PEP_ID=MMETSP1081-20130531/36322_1 /TAXON_ID=36882 /ORGANISM="Pyramimonas amylifera, Strain CCMP720" /LENGTH=77 /DNA_ID=CAMNT_0041902301 /DNA_START=129 /DNA_END=362 /DNA_ORIENTATION=+